MKTCELWQIALRPAFSLTSTSQLLLLCSKWGLSFLLLRSSSLALLWAESSIAIGKRLFEGLSSYIFPSASSLIFGLFLSYTFILYNFDDSGADDNTALLAKTIIFC